MGAEDNYREHNKNQLSQIKVNHNLKEETLKACKIGKREMKDKYKHKFRKVCVVSMIMFICVFMPDKVNNKADVQSITPSTYSTQQPAISKERGSMRGIESRSITYEDNWGMLEIFLDAHYNEGEFLIQPLTIQYYGEDEVLIEVSSNEGLIDDELKERVMIQGQKKTTSKLINWKYEQNKTIPKKITLTIQIYKINKKASVGSHKIYLEEDDGMFLLK